MAHPKSHFPAFNFVEIRLDLWGYLKFPDVTGPFGGSFNVAVCDHQTQNAEARQRPCFKHEIRRVL